MTQVRVKPNSKNQPTANLRNFLAKLLSAKRDMTPDPAVRCSINFEAPASASKMKTKTQKLLK